MLEFTEKVKRFTDSALECYIKTSLKSSQTLTIYKDKESFSFIKIELEDFEDDITHWMSLKPDNSGEKFSNVKYSMPPGLYFNLLNTLEQFVTDMIHHVNRLSYFTNGLLLIDRNACVMEPYLKQSTDTYRIFKYSNKIYIHLSFDPQTAVNHDDVLLQFIGPPQLTSALQEEYLKNKSVWDPGAGLYYNLSSAFNVKGKFFDYDNDDQQDCFICKHFLSDKDKTPIYCCDNESCDITFHCECILKLWSTEKTTMEFHDVVKGKCPECRTFCSIKKLL